jgi:hypothetical protein
MSYGTNTPYGLQPIYNLVGGVAEKVSKYEVYVDPVTNLGPTLANSAGFLFKNDPVVFEDNGAAGALAARYGTIRPMFSTLNAGAAATRLPGGVNGVSALVGTFVSCEYVDATGKYRVSDYIPNGLQVSPGTKIFALVCDDPNMLFEVQISTATNNQPAAIIGTPSVFKRNFIGANANLQLGGVVFTANAAAGQNPASGSIRARSSAVYLDGSSIDFTNGQLGRPTWDVKIVGVSPVKAQVTGTIGVDDTSLAFVKLICKINIHAYGSQGVAGPRNSL